MFYFYTVKHIVSTLEENKNINKVHRQFITQPFNFIYHIKLSTHHRVLYLCFWVILVITIYCLSMETFAKKYLKTVHPRVSQNVKCSRSFQKNSVWKILFCGYSIYSNLFLASPVWLYHRPCCCYACIHVVVLGYLTLPAASSALASTQRWRCLFSFEE